MAEVIFRNNRLVVRGFRRQYARAFVGIEGLKLSGNELILPVEWFLLELVGRRVPGLSLSPDVRAWLHECRTQQRNQKPIGGFPGMYSYQLDGARWLFNNERALLADAPGMGKTVQAIAAAEAVRLQCTEPPRMLVLCKNQFTLDWQKEIEEWAGRQSTCIKAPGRKRALDDWLATRTGYLIVGWGTLRVFPELCNIDWDVVIADESHKIKNHKTKTNRMFQRLKSRFMFLLSATPFSLHNGELWTSLRALQPKLFPSYWRFYNTFVKTVMAGDFPIIVGAKNEDVFAFIASHFVMQRKVSEHFDQLPPLRRENIHVPMKPQQAKAYIDMRDRLITELCGVPLAAPTDLAKFTRLRQIASTTATLWDTDQSGKLDAAVELVDTVDGQVVVATQYRATVAALMDRLAKAKVEAVQLVGGMNSAPVQRTFTSGKAKALVMTIGAGAESLNLHAADTMIVTERPWNPATEEQLENRVYRPATGKEGLTRILHLMHPGSIDTYVATRTWRRRTMTAKAMLEILHRQEART